jgi:hypothetical protein
LPRHLPTRGTLHCPELLERRRPFDVMIGDPL